MTPTATRDRHTDIIPRYTYILGDLNQNGNCILSRMQEGCSDHEFPSGTVKWHSAENFGNFFLYKTNHEITVQTSNYALGHLFQRNERFSPYKKLYINVQTALLVTADTRKTGVSSPGQMANQA